MVEGSKDVYVWVINIFMYFVFLNEQVRDFLFVEKNIVKFLLENLVNNYVYW